MSLNEVIAGRRKQATGPPDPQRLVAVAGETFAVTTPESRSTGRPKVWAWPPDPTRGVPLEAVGGPCHRTTGAPANGGATIASCS